MTQQILDTQLFKKKKIKRDIFHHTEPDKHGMSVCLEYKRSGFISRFSKRKTDGQGAHNSQPPFFPPPTSLFSFQLIFIASFLSPPSIYPSFYCHCPSSHLLLYSRLSYLLLHPSTPNLLAFFFFFIKLPQQLRVR